MQAFAPARAPPICFRPVMLLDRARAPSTRTSTAIVASSRTLPGSGRQAGAGECPQIARRARYRGVAARPRKCRARSITSCALAPRGSGGARFDR